MSWTRENLILRTQKVDDFKLCVGFAEHSDTIIIRPYKSVPNGLGGKSLMMLVRSKSIAL